GSGPLSHGRYGDRGWSSVIAASFQSFASTMCMPRVWAGGPTSRRCPAEASWIVGALPNLRAMGARRRSDGGGGFAVVFVVLLVVGLIIKYFWWIAGAAALVGAVFAVRAVVRKAEQRRLAAAERDEELARRAEQQHRWTLRGDSRGV